MRDHVVYGEAGKIRRAASAFGEVREEGEEGVKREAMDYHYSVIRNLSHFSSM